MAYHPEVLHEITPLMSQDVLYIADRYKQEFTYPLHTHNVYELNFVAHAPGVKRIVGDSSEVIGDYDLVLITSPNLEHVWEQHLCKSKKIREITIQFNLDFSETGLGGKAPFISIRQMISAAKNGLSFPLDTIMKVYNELDALSKEKDNFKVVTSFLNILHILSLCNNTRSLATSNYSEAQSGGSNSRMAKVKDYITKNYRDEIRLKTVSEIANMSESTFSRFFKMHTGKTLSNYVIDVRLAFAAKKLLETNEPIADISFQCGFNNLSNFNRIFKKKKGCSPSEFRDSYHKARRIV